MADEFDSQKKETKGNNKIHIIIALLSIVVIVEGIKIFLDRQERVATEQELASTHADLTTTLGKLRSIETELDQKIVEIKKLGGNVNELKQAKAHIELELRRTTKRNAAAVKELKDQVEGYELLLKAKDLEIKKLKHVNKELYTENTMLKNEQNKLSDSIVQLYKNKGELDSKIIIASQLRAENIVVKSISSKGKERLSPFKSKQLEGLKIEFNLAENRIAPIEGKKIFIQMIDENGQVIFDIAKGSGTFMLDNKEQFFTASQEILFDNTKQKLLYLYEKGSPYPPGKYTVEIYCTDYKIGTGHFEVK